ncbi:3-hydroxybutyrate dehydrogenase [Siminovitchia sediminis]|uniref:3-hydroxybutyrate dehydrogenase n=1 Tax=Siminovitchia sediminis TaxID=1274353 RepID=A0ABW4KGV2_9BACI
MVRDKVVFITGAARGIGLEIGKKFAENGAKVILSDLEQDKVEYAAMNLKSRGLRIEGIPCNVMEEDEIQRSITRIVHSYGRLDVLINNASLQHVSLIEEFPTEKFEQMIKIMLVGPFMCTKHAFPFMKQQQFGRIINMASINGLVGFSGKSAYNSAKHGLIGLTKVAALEGAEHGITVNALCPGYVDTPLVRNQMADLAQTRNVDIEKVLEEVIYPLVPQKRLLDVAEIAEYAIFLAGAAAKGVTGQAVVLDGGYTAQ